MEWDIATLQHFSTKGKPLKVSKAINFKSVELLHGLKNWNFLSIFTVGKIIKKMTNKIIHMKININ